MCFVFFLSWEEGREGKEGRREEKEGERDRNRDEESITDTSNHLHPEETCIYVECSCVLDFP